MEAQDDTQADVATDGQFLRDPTSDDVKNKAAEGQAKPKHGGSESGKEGLCVAYTKHKGQHQPPKLTSAPI